MNTPITISYCPDYTALSVQKAVKKVLEDYDLQSKIGNRDQVLLKPNLLQARPPEDMVTTHPSILEAVILEVLECGATPLVGDSPGGATRNLEKYWKTSGMYDICRKHDVEILNFEKLGVYNKKRNNMEYYISKPVLDADFVINLPKIKTHGLTMFTCSVKNLYGVVPGFIKVEYHKKAPQPSQFARLVVDIYALAQPDLNIVDGVVGMEGNGPSSGDPRPLNIVLAGANGVTMDSLICHLLGREPHKILTNRIAGEQGLGEIDPNKIKFKGHQPHIEDFKWPSNFSQSLEMIPESLAKGIMKFFWTRPAIDSEKCNQCLKCVNSCPTAALSGGVYIPEFDYPECINCLCCMEMCPQQAVFNDKSLLYKIGSKFSDSLD